MLKLGFVAVEAGFCGCGPVATFSCRFPLRQKHDFLFPFRLIQMSANAISAVNTAFILLCFICGILICLNRNIKWMNAYLMKQRE